MNLPKSLIIGLTLIMLFSMIIGVQASEDSACIDCHTDKTRLDKLTSLQEGENEGGAG